MKNLVLGIFLGVFLVFGTTFYMSSYHFIRLSTGWHRIPKDGRYLNMTFIDTTKEGFSKEFSDLPSNVQSYILKTEVSAITDKLQSDLKKIGQDILNKVKSALDSL